MSGADVRDRDGGGALPRISRGLFPFIGKVRADGGHNHERVTQATPASSSCQGWRGNPEIRRRIPLRRGRHGHDPQTGVPNRFSRALRAKGDRPGQLMIGATRLKTGRIVASRAAQVLAEPCMTSCVARRPMRPGWPRSSPCWSQRPAPAPISTGLMNWRCEELAGKSEEASVTFIPKQRPDGGDSDGVNHCHHHGARFAR